MGLLTVHRLWILFILDVLLGLQWMVLYTVENLVFTGPFCYSTHHR